MKEYIRKRALLLSDYITANRCTVRDAAKNCGVSKSTVHKDVTERLQAIDYPRFLEVKAILDFNLSERHLRGGEATRVKFLTATAPSDSDF